MKKRVLAFVCVLFVFSILTGILNAQESVVVNEDTGVYTMSPSDEKHGSAEGLELPQTRIELKTLKQVRLTCDFFMNSIIEEDIDRAFKEIAPFFQVRKEEIALLEHSTEKSLEEIPDRYGDCLGYRHVKTENLADTYVCLTYFQLFENHALRWLFYYYKPQEKWFFNEFYYDDKMKESFKGN